MKSLRVLGYSRDGYTVDQRQRTVGFLSVTGGG